ncbi:DUF5008 domain-containing protein [Sphingobacterium bovistauri]|uniref:DUF5008 domain-containing protein n=1 Tax=Sphingobacterium bovistauri TaxID=2781959 RepID=A0ABS7ZAC7_9SPHI|nr:DUF5008 domain-containing protein [Sphingobacterium bovistauri]MCA5005815.1 DUF5008 domain-containing protein [Sphingobacterium bovistauri]
MISSKIKYIGTVILSLLIIYSCQKKEEIGVNPYEGGKEPFGILFTSNRADPTTALPGEVVRVSVRGLKQYENKFDLRLNEVSTEIVTLSDSTADIRIPAEVSSGIVTVIMNGQIFYGPWIGIEGKVSVDRDYKIVNGFNSTVMGILPHAGGHIVVGNFTDFENELQGGKYLTGIHYINSLGQTSNDMDFRRRSNSGISSIVRLSSGEFMIGGFFTEFSKRKVDGIARLLPKGSLDTTTVAVINPFPEDKPLDGLDTVSSFNSGFINGLVSKVFETPDKDIIVVGSFTIHRKIDYQYSSRDNRRYVNTRVRNVAKLKPDGKLDSTFNLNNSGLNGFINDAVCLKDGRIVIAGAFTNYNGKSVRNIVCIKPNGQVDDSFTNVGGTDLPILSLTYNPTNDKLVIAGAFKTYGGKANNGVVILNTDGTEDQSFKMGDLDGESPNYAYKLNNGRVLVTGFFSKYNGVRRSGLLILESNGVAKQEYNNLGSFAGIPLTITETTSSLGNPAILLGGSIFSVDGYNVGNIVKIEIKN